MNKKIAQVVFGLPVEGPFDYFVKKFHRGKVTVGARVYVPFGSRRLAGYVVGLSDKSTYRKLKSIFSVIDEKPIIDSHRLKLTRQFASHYCCSWGEAIETSLPSSLRKQKKIEFTLPKTIKKETTRNHQVLLLHDQTNKRYWTFMLNYLRKTISRGQGVIILVPEISMIEYVYRRLQKEMNENIAVLDKRLKASEELDYWIKIKEGRSRIVIGTRSAIFAPSYNLGLIVVLHESNNAYKQEQSPFYHAREVAFMRAKINRCSLIFVDATPSVEIWQATRGKKVRYQLIEEKRYSQMQVVDMSNYRSRRDSLVSVPLRQAMEKVITENGRILLFLNRKGFSTYTHCDQCGYKLKCERCDTHLTYLYSKKKFVCRHCNSQKSPPRICPQCQKAYLRYTGMGIEKLESEISRIFPQARVTHYDKETKKIPKEANVIIATQAILREEQHLLVDLVGVLRWDTELNRLDFRSGEKAFSLLIHLRRLTDKKIIVQTRLPDNYCLKAAQLMDYEKFYKQEIGLRKDLGLPPFNHLVAIKLRGPKEDVAVEQIHQLYEGMVNAIKDDKIEILEPQPDAVPKLRGTYRHSILIKTRSVKKIMPFIQIVLKSFKKKSKVIINVDVE